MGSTLVERAGLGIAIDGGTFDGSAILGTTPVKVNTATHPAGVACNIACNVVNPNGAGVILALRVVPRGATAPVFDATFSPTGGGWILPGATRRFVIPSTVDLYIVASAAASSWGVASDIYV
jgi:hypothetical protein